MRKYFYILAAFAAILASCNKNGGVQEPSVKDFTIDVALPSTGKTLWNAGDTVCLNGHVSSALQAGGVSRATFTFPGYTLAEGSAVNVICNGDGSACHFTIPREQTFVDGVFPGCAAPLWGTGVSGGNIELHNVCSMICMQLSGSDNIASMTISAKGGELITGGYELGYSSGYFNGSFAGGDYSEMKIRFSSPVAVGGEGTQITLPILSGTYKSGLEVLIYSTSGRYMVLEILPEGGKLEADGVLDVNAAFTPDRAAESLDDYDENPLFDTGTLSAGTYNILYSTGRSGCPENTWDAAKASIASIIMNLDCDIMTLNELGTTEISYLKNTLSGYGFITKPNTAKETYSYAPGIIYRTLRFEVLEDGIFWTSDPDTPTLVTSAAAYSYMDPVDSTVYTASPMRCCVWAHLRDKESGRTFYWFATHPHIRGDDSSSSLFNTIYSLNSGNIRSLLKQIPYVNTSGEPMVVAGDMNSWSGYVSYPLFSQAGLVNTFEAAVNSGNIDSDTAVRPGTCPGTTPSSYSYIESHRIDHVFCSGFSVGAFRNDYSKYYNSAEGCARHPSDHIPVKVKLTIIN